MLDRIGAGISSWFSGGTFAAGFVMNDGLVGALMSRDGGFGMGAMGLWNGGGYGMGGGMFSPYGYSPLGDIMTAQAMYMNPMMMNPAALMYGTITGRINW